MAAALAFVIGCGGKAVIDGEPEGDGGGGSGAASSSSSAGGAGGSGALRILLLDGVARANCQPVVEPDPLRLRFTLRFVNTSSASAEAVIPGGALVGGAGTTSFEVAPSTGLAVGPGQTRDVELQKVDGSGFGTPGCSWCSETDIRLRLDIEVGGQAVPFEEPIDSVSCVF